MKACRVRNFPHLEQSWTLAGKNNFTIFKNEAMQCARLVVELPDNFDHVGFLRGLLELGLVHTGKMDLAQITNCQTPDFNSSTVQQKKSGWLYFWGVVRCLGVATGNNRHILL